MQNEPRNIWQSRGYSFRAPLKFALIQRNSKNMRTREAPNARVLFFSAQQAQTDLWQPPHDLWLRNLHL